MRRTFAVVTLTAIMSTTSTIAYAQDIAPQATVPATPIAPPGPESTPAVQQPQSGLQDIIVTATRRQENLQNVPVAVSAIPQAELTKQGVFDTTDLNHALPNLQVSSPYGKQQPNFSIRGVGVGTEFNANAASPIGVYVDEVYQAFRSSHGQQLYDLNQIEVVRGPQGTLYGRNTTGGAINFITNAPTLSGQRGYLTAGYGSYNRFATEGAIEVTPVDGVLGVRLAATFEDSDPYIHNILPAGVNRTVAGGASGLNLNSGFQPGGAKNYGLRGTIRFKPTDSIDLSLKAYAGESDGGTETPIPSGQSKTSDVINYTSKNFLLGGLFSALGPTGLVPTSYSANANGLDGNKTVQDDTLGRALSNASGVVFNAKFKLTNHLPADFRKWL